MPNHDVDDNNDHDDNDHYNNHHYDDDIYLPHLHSRPTYRSAHSSADYDAD
jgi:hypothetical protein